MLEKTCCFFGHRKIETNQELKMQLFATIEKLITDNSIDTFLFGSKSQFDKLCYETVTKLKSKYPHIKRVYVRAEYPFISEDYKMYLLQSYEDSYYAEKMINAGKAAHIERNREMIDNSSICVVYYNNNYTLDNRNSGTEIAYNYAKKKNKRIINVYKPDKL